MGNNLKSNFSTHWKFIWPNRLSKSIFKWLFYIKFILFARKLGWRLGLQAITGILVLAFFLSAVYRSASLYHPQRRAILHLKNQRRKVKVHEDILLHNQHWLSNFVMKTICYFTLSLTAERKERPETTPAHRPEPTQIAARESFVVGLRISGFRTLHSSVFSGKYNWQSCNWFVIPVIENITFGRLCKGLKRVWRRARWFCCKRFLDLLRCWAALASGSCWCGRRRSASSPSSICAKPPY